MSYTEGRAVGTSCAGPCPRSGCRFDAADLRRRSLAGLEHGSEDERFDAVWRLARTENPQIVPRLITLLQGSPDMGVRKDAAYVLGFSGDLQVRSVLLAALRDPVNDLDVRCFGFRYLLKQQDIRTFHRAPAGMG